MKLVRHGAAGAERPGLIDATGAVRDLSAHIPDIAGAALAPATLARLAALDPTTLPLVDSGARLGVPVAGSGKFIGIGLNYADHAAEAGMPLPTEPVVFMKTVSSLAGPFDPLVYPPGATKLDWEVELGIVIGTRAQRIGEADALAHVAGYCIVNDISERAWQLERGGTWDKGKGHDGFGPVGPWLVTTEEVPDPQALELWLDIDGVRRQHGNTRTMVFSCAQIISYLSHFMTLLPGDLITTGTPPGVGMGLKPPRWLAPGNTMRLGIAGLGVQCTRVVG